MLEISPHPDSRRAWLAALWRYRDVLVMLAKKDFQTRYKRASLGILWAVAVPILQAVVMAVVFSRILRTAHGPNFGVYVMSGIIGYWYLSTSISAGSTAIVDASTLTDKVWFPRVLLPVIPVLSNLVGLGVTVLVLLVAMPILSTPETARTLLIVPAVALLVAFTAALSLCLGALHVYFRDVRFIVQAALLVWLYVTPILYPIGLLGSLRPLVEANPLTGIVTLFHMASAGEAGPWIIPVLVSLLSTAALLLVGCEAHRHHDRLFADRL